MTTEIRDYDSKTLVVFTDEGKVAQRILNWNECFKIIPYEQEQYSKKRVALVGLDFYLPKNRVVLRRLERAGFSYG